MNKDLKIKKSPKRNKMKASIKYLYILILLISSFAIGGCNDDEGETQPQAQIIILPEMEGKVGDQLTITGRNFREDVVLYVSGQEVTFDVQTSEELTFTISETMKSGLKFWMSMQKEWIKLYT